MSQSCIWIILTLLFGNIATAAESANKVEIVCSGPTALQFSNDWNDEVKTLTIGTWKLPSFSNQKTYEQALDGPGLILRIHSDNNGCLEDVEVWSRRDQNIAIAAQIAWIKTMKILGVCTQKARDNVFKALKLYDQKAGGRIERDGIIFKFSEQIMENSLQAIIM